MAVQGMYKKKKVKKKKVFDPNRPNLLNHEKRLKEKEETVQSLSLQVEELVHRLNRMDRIQRRQASEITRLESLLRRRY